MESPPSLPRFRRRRRRRSDSALTAARSAAVSASSTASVHASVHASTPLPPVRQSRWRISTSAESIDDPPPQPPSISWVPSFTFSTLIVLGVASDVASAPPRSLANDIAPLTRAPTTARPHVPPSSTPDTDANSPSNAAIAPASAPAPRTASSQHSARSHAMDRSAFRPLTDDTTHRTSGVSSDGVPALTVTRPSILRNAPSKDVTHSPRPTHSRVMFTTPNIASNDAYAIPRIDDVSLVPPGKLRRAADSRASATSAAAPATHALDSLWSVNPELMVRYHGRHPARSIATGADNSIEAPHAVRTSLACSADLNPAPTALSSERSA